MSVRTFEDALDTQVGILLDHFIRPHPDFEHEPGLVDNVDFAIDHDNYLVAADSALAALVLRSGDDPLFILRDIQALVVRKQHDYGHNNILRHGRMGLRVRMADKVERLRNIQKFGRNPKNESADDSWRDLIGYSLIGMMLDADTFTLPLARDVK